MTVLSPRFVTTAGLLVLRVVLSLEVSVIAAIPSLYGVLQLPSMHFPLLYDLV